jgi:hypothetical protein
MSETLILPIQQLSVRMLDPDMPKYITVRDAPDIRSGNPAFFYI